MLAIQGHAYSGSPARRLSGSRGDEWPTLGNFFRGNEAGIWGGGKDFGVRGRGGLILAEDFSAQKKQRLVELMARLLKGANISNSIGGTTAEVMSEEARSETMGTSTGDVYSYAERIKRHDDHVRQTATLACQKIRNYLGGTPPVVCRDSPASPPAITPSLQAPPIDLSELDDRRSAAFSLLKIKSVGTTPPDVTAGNSPSVTECSPSSLLREAYAPEPLSEDEEEIGEKWIWSEWERRVADVNAERLRYYQLPTNRSDPPSRRRPVPCTAWDVLDGVCNDSSRDEDFHPRKCATFNVLGTTAQPEGNRTAPRSKIDVQRTLSRLAVTSKRDTAGPESSSFNNDFRTVRRPSAVGGSAKGMTDDSDEKNAGLSVCQPSADPMDAYGNPVFPGEAYMFRSDGGTPRVHMPFARKILTPPPQLRVPYLDLDDPTSTGRETFSPVRMRAVGIGYMSGLSTSPEERQMEDDFNSGMKGEMYDSAEYSLDNPECFGRGYTAPSKYSDNNPLSFTDPDYYQQFLGTSYSRSDSKYLNCRGDSSDHLEPYGYHNRHASPRFRNEGLDYGAGGVDYGGEYFDGGGYSSRELCSGRGRREGNFLRSPGDPFESAARGVGAGSHANGGVITGRAEGYYAGGGARLSSGEAVSTRVKYARGGLLSSTWGCPQQTPRTTVGPPPGFAPLDGVNDVTEVAEPASPTLPATLERPVHDSSTEDRAEIAGEATVTTVATSASSAFSPESPRFQSSYDVSGSPYIYEQQIELSTPDASAAVPTEETQRRCKNSDDVLLATSNDVNAGSGNAQGGAGAGGNLTDEIVVSSGPGVNPSKGNAQGGAGAGGNLIDEIVVSRGPVVRAGGRALVYPNSRVQGRVVLTANEMAMLSDVVGRGIVSLWFGEQPRVTLEAFVRWSASVTLGMSRATPTSARGATPSCSAVVVYSGNPAPYSNARAADNIAAMIVNAHSRPAFAAVSRAILNGNLSVHLAVRTRAGASSSISCPPAAASASTPRRGILFAGGNRNHNRNRTVSFARGSRRRVTFNVDSDGGDDANVVDAPVEGRMLRNAAISSASQGMVRKVPVLSSWLARIGSRINAAAAAVVGAATGRVESTGERSRRVVEGSGTAPYEQDIVMPEAGGRRARGVPHRVFLLPRCDGERVR